jgi:hypothetical protein
MGILAILEKAGKGKGVSSDVEEAPESKPAAKSDYRAELKEAAEEGDWDAFASAVEGLCKQCMKT